LAVNRDGFSVTRKGERGALCGIIFFCLLSWWRKVGYLFVSMALL
jgi:hypothetical protein